MTRLSRVLVACGLAACGDNHEGRDAGGPDGAAGWADRQLAGPAGEDVLDLAIAGDLLLVAGFRDGVLGQDNLEPSGNAVGFVTAVGANGARRWERVLDTAGADTVEAIQVTGSELALVGRTTGAFPGFTNAGQVDAFVARAPLDGTSPLALLQLGDERPQHPVRIARDTDGGLLIAGFDDTYVVQSVVVAWENPTVARVRPGTPALDWTRRDDTSTSDAYHGLAAAGVTGELFVGGEIASGAERGPFVRRLDAQGKAVWTRRLGTSGLDAVTAIELGPDGRLYAAGATFEQLGARSYGQQDMFVAVLDPATGELVRTMQAGSTGSDYPRDLAIAADGTLYVTGETDGQLPGGTASGDYDVAVLRFAPDGRWTGAWQRGTTSDDTGRAIARTDGAVFVGGYTYGALVDGAAHGGGRDGFVVRIDDAQLFTLIP